MQTEPKEERTPNRLIHEKSLYLLQHAHNPVDWFPWGKEAFEEAEEQDKPVFVSIGYSACHWCHVMEKESFDDEEVAKLMNEAFVCVKVDREERPDIDSAYMAVCHVMGRSCGWPLNIVMTPKKKPFFAASYIPKTSRFGLAGMIDLIPQISQLWRKRRPELEALGEKIIQDIDALERKTPETELNEAVLHDAYEQFALSFDAENGGFGRAPKFPMPHNLLFLMRYWNRTKQKMVLRMVEKTLSSMRQGGVFDHIGFGFHRYSTDNQWLVPHFEKMLYDQALLAIAYTEAYQATATKNYMLIAKETLEYVLRDLASPEGGFYSAEDADSEGEEGKFYLWTEAEIKEILSHEDSELVVKLFGVEALGNYVEQGRARSGRNILHLTKSLEQFALESNLPLDEIRLKIEKIRSLLFRNRELRVHPLRDEKILADWNGLMIAALARASQVFGGQEYLQTAIKAANFVLKKMKGSDGVLYHRYAKGEKAIEGFLDDYAFLTWGLIEIYEACFDYEYLRMACELTNSMVSRFWDKKGGGFYFTAENSEQVVLRRKENYDGALPSGNSVAMLNLLRLSRLTGEHEYEEIASKTSGAFSGGVKEAPTSHTFMLLGVDFALGPAYTVTMVGSATEEGVQNMLGALRKSYLPNTVTLLVKASENGSGYERIGGEATAYVCRGQACMPPANEVNKLMQLLEIS